MTVRRKTGETQQGPNNLQLVSATSRKQYHPTELGNTERLLDTFGEDFKFSPAFGFIVWNGKHWKLDAELEVRLYAMRTIQGMYAEASTLLDEASIEKDKERRQQLSKAAEDLNKWARQSETSKMIASMLQLVKMYCHVEDSIFDTHPYLFNFQNGTIDLQTGVLQPHKRTDYLTVCCPYNYNPQAEAPTFKRFFADTMLHREDLMQFMQKALGLAMTADVSEQAWFLLLGTGENGKSTLLETVKKCMGPYADTMNDRTISVVSHSGSTGSSPTPDIASLKGKRLITVSETEDGARLATQLIKRMSGGDEERARFLNKDPFTFHYTHKLFLYTNHEPIVRETGHGFWRRVRRIPFDFNLNAPENVGKKDEKLPEKLQAEAEGILVWLVEGARLWAAEGLGKSPEAVAEATAAYRESQDIFAQFVRDCCEVGPDFKVAPKELFTAFKTWQEDEMNMSSYTGQAFKRTVLDHGYKDGRTMHGRFYTGLRLRKAGTAPAAVIVHTDTPTSLDLDLEAIEGL